MVRTIVLDFLIYFIELHLKKGVLKNLLCFLFGSKEINSSSGLPSGEDILY